MRTLNSTALFLAASLLIPVGIARAQEAEAPAPTPDTAAPADSGSNAPAAAANAPTPLPGPEVMLQPNQKGLRLTPAMVQAMSKGLGSKWKRDYALTADQGQQLQGVLARRMMKLGRDHEEQWQDIIEYGFEGLLKTQMGHGNFTPEMSREFGQRVGRAGPFVREFFDGLRQESSPILTPEQREKFDRDINEGLENLKRFDDTMKRWADGGYKPGEHPFDDSPKPPATAEGESKAPPKKPELQRAEQQVEWTMRSMEPSTWEQFVRSCGKLFKFDADQTARAEKILAGYKAKADAIMTPEWKEHMRQNRIKLQLSYSFDKKQVTAPWTYNLAYEYNEALRPLNEMGDSLRKEVMAITTEAQRQAVVEDLQKRAGEFGLTITDADQVVLGLKPE